MAQTTLRVMVSRAAVSSGLFGSFEPRSGSHDASRCFAVRGLRSATSREEGANYVHRIRTDPRDLGCRHRLFDDATHQGLTTPDPSQGQQERGMTSWVVA